MDAKTRITRSALTRLFRLVPVDTAHVATFGGQGVEAGIWLEFGVSPENGWLVERSKKEQKKLMDRYPFQISCSNLQRFPNVFREKRGADAGLDFFHWDLSGTVDCVSRELPVILPLLIQGKGKLLAVTYADSRANASLKEQETLKKVGQRVFGEAVFSLLLESLTELYRHEPLDGVTENFVTSEALREQRSRNTALREIGALLHLLFACASIPGIVPKSSLQTPIEALHGFFDKKIGLRQFLRVLQRTYLPVRLEAVEKSVYVSRYSATPKRMRHFLFRIVGRERGDVLLTEFAPEFAKLLMAMACRYVHDETDTLFTREGQKEMTHEASRVTAATDAQAPVGVADASPTRQAEIDALMQAIHPIANPIGGDFLKSIQRLEVLARTPEMAPHPILQQIRDLLDQADESAQKKCDRPPGSRNKKGTASPTKKRLPLGPPLLLGSAGFSFAESFGLRYTYPDPYASLYHPCHWQTPERLAA